MCQIGSREHYAIPRVLHESGRLDLLLTDYWSEGKGIHSGAAAKVAQRYHPDLAAVPVEQLGLRRIVFDLYSRLRKRSLWDTVLRRNQLFEKTMIKALKRMPPERFRERPGVIFSYSYAALELFSFFREYGWKTVLGQVDPGFVEEEIVAAEYSKFPEVNSTWTRAPRALWERWEHERELADCIMVNSPWSKDAMLKSGIPEDKVRVVPLAFESPAQRPPRKSYPASFDEDRLLRVLYLGNVLIRKGAHLVFEAARRMADAPVEWIFVGPSEMPLPDDLARSKRVRWVGPVSRAETVQIYADADAFILPTLSDGFALTQLEAQAVRLPVLASRFCGAVVRDKENGLLIDPLSAEGIQASVQYCLDHPDQLQQFSDRSRVDERFSLGSLQKNLLALEAELFA